MQKLRTINVENLKIFIRLKTVVRCNNCKEIIILQMVHIIKNGRRGRELHYKEKEKVLFAD